MQLFYNGIFHQQNCNVLINAMLRFHGWHAKYKTSLLFKLLSSHQLKEHEEFIKQKEKKTVKAW